jgi:hypothetical protein
MAGGRRARGRDHSYCARTEVFEQLLLRLLPDQERHEVPDGGVVEVAPKALNQDRHLIDRHRRKCDVELVLDRLFQVRFVCSSPQLRNPRARIINLDRHGWPGSLPAEAMSPMSSSVASPSSMS